MQICIAIDKFKGSLTAVETATAIKNGFNAFSPTNDFYIIPMADGGDGSLDILKLQQNAEVKMINTLDPINRKISSPVLIFKDSKTVFIEMAKISGLSLLTRDERNPYITNTYGLGEAIKKVLDLGVKEIILGLGGSATNDGGVGMLLALGCKFLNIKKENIGLGGLALKEIEHIDISSLDARLQNVKIKIISDVTNPLLGENGATLVYGRQKGASRYMLLALEEGMSIFARKTFEILGKEIGTITGSGAAGGTAAAIYAYLGGEIVSGWEFFAKVQNLEEAISKSDLVISGEGRFDSQSLSGKVVSGVDSLCKKYNKEIWIFCGESTISLEDIKSSTSISQIFSIMDIERQRSLAISNAFSYLEILAKYAAAVEY